MAKLFYKDDISPDYFLEITPIAGEMGKSEEGYEVALCLGEQTLFSASRGGMESEMSYYYLTLIGEVFRSVANIDSMFVTIENKFGIPYSVPIVIHVGTPFISLFLSKFKNEIAEWIDVEILFATDWTKEPDGYISPSFRTFIRSSVDVAVQFGMDLLAEIDDLDR